MVTEAKKRANAKWEAKSYDKTLFRFKRGDLDKIRDHAALRGESLNGFVNRAIAETMARDMEETK